MLVQSFTSWNYNMNKNNMKENSIREKSFEFDMLQSRARLAINEKQKYFSLPDNQLSEKLTLFLVLTTGKKNKSEFVNKFAGIVIAIDLI